VSERARFVALTGREKFGTVSLEKTMICIQTSRHVPTGALIVRLSGAEDESRNDNLRVWLDAHARTRPVAVVVDVIESRSLAGAAIRAIVEFISSVRGRGGRAAIAAGRGHTMESLLAARAHLLAPIRPRVDDAARLTAPEVTAVRESRINGAVASGGAAFA
jgi:hypothetical protein